ncbi:hypothetical protein OV203_33325 [Nannocystis sp. ILAH1]|uniref:monooxygenase n=1 Tax=unclassified Nannocystis TaxID=2627009 RepID=UPI002270EA64|nr:MULTISPECIES: hypothetical protein [unclassified Nannocystis]MCY0992068.1 hypothetical protein [Nannocystis sp. ILAH1]MCY1064319.1 hypothetical protein [Nannocystis sp. RBIL2]
MKLHPAVPSLVTLALIVGCESTAGSTDGSSTENPGSTEGSSLTEGATPTEGSSSTEGSDPTEGSNAPTYYKDIARIVNNECLGCHRDGGVAPFSLEDPEAAASLSGLLAASVLSRTMPPMPVNNDGSCHTYKNARWLSDEEIALFQGWSQAGAPLGDPADAPPPPVDDSPKLTGELATFDIGLDYTPQPAPGEQDEYRCFVVDPGITEDSFITGYDILPGDPRVVHHVSLFYLLDAEAEAAAAALDEADPEPGYRCFGAAGVQKSILYGVWVPGSGATLLPEGTGIFHGAGRQVVVQVHYNVPVPGLYSDRSKVTYQIEQGATLERAYLVPAGSFEFSVPPGDPKANVSAEMTMEMLGWYAGITIPGGLRVWGSMPHMHVIGKTQQTTLHQQGSEQCLTDVDRWDFHWQDLWWYETPIDVSPNDTISISCNFDTSGREMPTTWGEGTQDEMCTNILYATLLD